MKEIEKILRDYCPTNPVCWEYDMVAKAIEQYVIKARIEGLRKGFEYHHTVEGANELNKYIAQLKKGEGV